jgi:hypothetical protein
MRTLFCLVVIAIAAVGCRQQPGTRTAVAPNTNVVSKLDDRGRPTETTVYATNGVVKQRTFFETTDDGRILAARTVDAEGKLKWTDKYTYETGTSRRPSELQRLKPNGEAVAVRFVYSPDGTQRKVVIGPDGQPVPEAEQAAALGE